MIAEGTKAPDFTLPDQYGKMHSLADYRGQKVILYFYPKDMTSGCSKQACGFAERYPLFLEKETMILGVSRDTVASHQKFAEKYGLPFPLLADPEMNVLRAYDTLLKKQSAGKERISSNRTTYLIDENGIIVKAMEKVKPAENPEDMLRALQA